MPVWGKLLGLIFGSMFLNLPGAFIGLIIGHFFDRGYSQEFARLGGLGRYFTNPDSFRSNAVFFNSLFSALGHIAKADGRVTSKEIAIATALMDELELSGETRDEAQNAFRQGKANDFPLADTLKGLVDNCHGRRDLLQIFLEILIQAALADGSLSSPESTVLQKVAKALGFDRNELTYLINAHRAQQRFHRHDQSQSAEPAKSAANHLQDAYDILGISQTADEKTTKRAYKKRMAQHHPDKLAAKGLPQQAMDLAKQKTQAIQAAYELIKTNKGW